MSSTLDRDVIASALARIERVGRRPGPPLAGAAPTPLPIHTLMVPAPEFSHDYTRTAGRAALRLAQLCASDSVVLARALALPGWEDLPTDPGQVDQLLARLDADEASVAARWPSAALAHQVYRRVVTRLARTPVQDVRVDLQDLTGPPHALDALSVDVARKLAKGLYDGTLPARCGVRIGSLLPGSAAGSLRVLDQVVTTLADAASGILPDGFVVSVSGVTSPDTVAAFTQVLGHLEQRRGLPKGALKLELSLDRTEAILDSGGSVQAAQLMRAAKGRCAAIRIDTLALATTAGPALAAVARDLVRLAVAGTNVSVSAGTSPPVPDPGRFDIGSPMQRTQLFSGVRTAWRAHFDAVSADLDAGAHWGWDLDAGQLPARLAAVAAHARAHLAPALTRLALRVQLALDDGGVSLERLVDGQAQLDVILRWVDCGAVDVGEVLAAGLDNLDIDSRSFRVIVARRRRS